MSPPDRHNIVVTWPKTKSLQAYLDELTRARQQKLFINYRVSRLPPSPWPQMAGGKRPRCYMAHDGAIRGYCEVLAATQYPDGWVEGWPAGLYIVRSPAWHPLETPIPMPGFRGWRWMNAALLCQLMQVPVEQSLV